ncbi:response regulator transcription factor [Colwellia sp. MB3u-70]|uniref:response regulator n=1 Tax=unclassified Colwellia TaxID=196834 RepID=UPI0015F3A5FA|nr:MULTISPECIES: response regulator transcription factor [unclassified Colwellia]MBA6293799.1 response regulator transcription factor [Colwellia sp. MB3u-8]MBA6306747.1 response regulator transcription factor [Colwellia sp. MB3u-70]MBA6342701.1 response regulator transcription factor [Colwellia sp. MB02u-10]
MIKVLLVDDHPLFREGLTYRLSLDDDIAVVGEAENGRQALELIKRLEFDIVLMDINMPDMDGMYVLELIKEQGIDCKVLMLSMHDNKEYILGAMRHGADGYILKDVPGQELIEAIKKVISGKNYFSSEVTEILSKELSGEQRGIVTRREQLVLRLISQGLNNKRIAQEINVSVRTVETHKRNIKQKLGIDSTMGLMRYGIDYGLDR